MSQLHARLRKIESMTRKLYPIEKRPSALELAVESISDEDLFVLQDDLRLRREGREADLTASHLAATARLEHLIARFTMAASPENVEAQRMNR